MKGCGKKDRTDFWLNPQYKINIAAPTQNSHGKLVSVIISLMQMDQVRRRLQFENNYADSNAPIAFSLFKIRSEYRAKNRKFAPNELTRIFNDSNYVGQREITKRFDLEPGSFVLIPSLYEKGEAMNFFIRVFIET